MASPERASAPSPVVWAAVIVALGALAWFGWQSNQRRPTAAPAAATPATEQSAPAPAPANDPQLPPGSLAG